jgi:hypothetical protein
MPRGVYNRTSMEHRFWARVNKQGPTVCAELGPCWTWTGPTDRGGYGNIKQTHGKSMKAHRYAFFLKHGRYPKPCGLHRCDNPPCCNAEHIFEGTTDDNNKDARRKGRSKWVSGSKVYNAKLTEAKVRHIRKRAAAGESNRALAKEFGMCPQTIDVMILRKTWRHVV